MSRSVDALATPEVLVWARESSGLGMADAARRLRIDLDQLAEWEAGEVHPTVAQLRKAAEVYRRPLAVFFLPTAPKKFEAMRDFRRVAGTEPGQPSPQLMFEIRRARQRREVAVELLRELDERAPGVSLAAERTAPAAVVAAALREWLGISMADQFAWAQLYDALNGWKAAVERVGVLVFQVTGVKTSEARGYSEFHEPLPFILLNTQESPRGRVFTLFHELAHLVLRSTGLCDLHEQTGQNGPSDAIEVYCNRVAGAALVPADYLLVEPEVRRHTGPEWSADQLENLANRYSVSREVLLRALLLAGRTTPAFYEAMRRDFLAEYDSLVTRKKQSPVPHFRKVIAWNGRRYSRLVLDAYDEERITGSDLSDYLGVKMGELEKVRAALVSKHEVPV